MKWKSKSKYFIKLSLLFCLLVSTWFFYRTGVFNLELIGQYRSENPALSVILFIVLYATFVITALPSLPLNLAGGFFWGGILGGIYTAAGVTLGSLISFIVARKIIGQPFSRHYDNKWISYIQKEFDESGWKFVAFARINPIIPTGPLNYFLGLTSISTMQFIIPTFVFLLPPSIFVAYIGDAFQTITVQTTGVSDFLYKMLGISASISVLFLLKIAISIKRKQFDDKKNFIHEDSQ